MTGSRDRVIEASLRSETGSYGWFVWVQALEYQLQQGGADAAREDLYLAPRVTTTHQYAPKIHANGGVLQLLLPVGSRVP